MLSCISYYHLHLQDAGGGAEECMYEFMPFMSFLDKMAGIEEEMAENRAIYYLFIIGVRSFFITFVLMNCILCY